MAHMYPDVSPLDIEAYGERHLYQCLRDRLGADWHVIHSLPYTDPLGHRLHQGECDFLLLHPDHGLLVVETKSGFPRYDRHTGTWQYEETREPMRRSPVEQVQRATRSIVRILGDRLPAWRDRPPRYGHAVAFPDARAVMGALPPDFHRAGLLLAGDLDRLEHWARLALESFGPELPSPGSDLLHQTIAALLPAFDLVPSLDARLAADERALVRLTDEQAFILDCLTDNRRAVIHGSAGSGKTLVAATAARRLVEAGRRAADPARHPADAACHPADPACPRVLILCFNNLLPAWISAHCGPDVEVCTFHEMCRRIVEEATGCSPVPPRDPARARAYWTEDLACAASEALPRYPVRYDAILVDEAQDFHDLWWDPVLGLLAEPDWSRCYLFMDAAQRLYDRDANLPLRDPCRLTLRRTCRNTRAIASYVCDLVGHRGVRLGELPEGSSPVEVPVSDAQEEVDAVRRTLHHLVHEQGLDPGRIVVLGYHRLANTAFWNGGRPRRLGNLELVDIDQERGPGQVSYSTVKRFKGLERDVVLLVEVPWIQSDHLGEEERTALMYVGASRAKHGLYVFGRGRPA